MTIKEIVAVPKASKTSPKQAMTIAKASGRSGIDRAKAERILDPRGYFHPKWPSRAKR